MTNAMIDYKVKMISLEYHIEDLMKVDWEADSRDEEALSNVALYELHGQRID